MTEVPRNLIAPLSCGDAEPLALPLHPLIINVDQICPRPGLIDKMFE